MPCDHCLYSEKRLGRSGKYKVASTVWGTAWEIPSQDPGSLGGHVVLQPFHTCQKKERSKNFEKRFQRTNILMLILKNIVPQDVTENFTKPLFSLDNMRYKITSVTFSLTAKTTQSYSTHKYSTTLSSAIIHMVKVMISVPEAFPNLTDGIL